MLALTPPPRAPPLHPPWRRAVALLLGVALPALAMALGMCSSFWQLPGLPPAGSGVARRKRIRMRPLGSKLRGPRTAAAGQQGAAAAVGGGGGAGGDECLVDLLAGDAAADEAAATAGASPAAPPGATASAAVAPLPAPVPLPPCGAGAEAASWAESDAL